MRELTYFVASTLDGHIAGPGGDLSAFPMGDHVDWQVATFPETIPAAHWGALGIAGIPEPTFDTVLMGRRTYEVGLAEGADDPYPHLDQVVFSRTLRGTEVPVTVDAGDPVDTVRALKQLPGAGIWLCGGGTLADHLADEIDTLIIKLNPLTLGAGVRLFAGPQASRATRWTRRDHQTFASGVTVLRYTRTPGSSPDRTDAGRSEPA